MTLIVDAPLADDYLTMIPSKISIMRAVITFARASEVCMTATTVFNRLRIGRARLETAEPALWLIKDNE